MERQRQRSGNTERESARWIAAISNRTEQRRERERGREREGEEKRRRKRRQKRESELKQTQEKSAL
jgi:hypothetical protein